MASSSPSPAAPGSTATAFADKRAQQPIFRALLAAISYPGRLHTAHAPAGVADVVTTLVDRQVSLADPYHALPEALWRWLGITATDAAKAQYIVCPGQDSPNFYPPIGTLDSPELGATVIIPVPELTALTAGTEDGLYIAGPSRKDPKVRGLNVKGLHSDWLSQRADWHPAFPLGTDWFFVAPSAGGSFSRAADGSFSPAADGSVAIAALPRSCAVATAFDDLAAFFPGEANLSQKKERLDP